MQKDYLKISEEELKESDISATNYTFKMTVKEKAALERIREKNEHLLKKQKQALSSMIKLIIENTYLYLNNNERFFLKDVDAIYEKPYYKDSISKDFKSRIKVGNKEYDFIKELVRNQLIRSMNNIDFDEEEELTLIQLRLAKDDERLYRIIAGKNIFNLDEFLTGYLRYFLSLPEETKKYVLTYPKAIKLERAINEHRCIIINDIKYKPFKIVDGRGAIRRKCLLCFDVLFDSFHELPGSHRNILDMDIDFTEELFEPSEDEYKVLDAYNKLDVIEVSFKLLNNDNKYINQLIDDNCKSSYILERKHSNAQSPLERVKIKYFDGILNDIKRADKKSINYINYSENYNEFIKLTKDKQEELEEYIKEVNKKVKRNNK